MKKSIVILMVMVMVIVTACSKPSNSNVEETNIFSEGQGKTSAEKKTIVISSFFHEDFFKEGKKRYEAKYPHITIDVQSVDSTDANFEAKLAKYEKSIGTAMLSGNGPDLIEMDQLPTESYVNKKLLANLGDMMDKDDTFHKDDYFNNIFEGIKVNGGLYGIPMGFFVYGLIGNETLIEKSGVKIDDNNWNWSEFANVTKGILQKINNDSMGLARTTPEYMVSELVNDQYATFVSQENGKASFESTAFTDLLKEVKHLQDEKIIDSEGGVPIFRVQHINSPADYVREMKQSQFYPDNSEHKSKLYLKPNAGGRQSGGYFRTYQTVGLNEKSEVKEEAWHFLKFMLSDEMKDKASRSGFPLNKKSYAWIVAEALRKGTVESNHWDGPLKGIIYEITQADIDDLNKFLTHAKYPVQFKESKINEIIIEESEGYFKGQKSPEEVAKLIQNRVTTVLNE
ncbi:ABC transporter substrate-binding protein [Paenibacillus sp. L3-i20]|uniref:ABC transporter substrate-binding protein n=1 Tax=Paenibacillus sp. L3-i20 TaxID=2905833 RepID=UPI001EDCE89C|nr:extracellular solute-binding protein [Paenibacillus sp. L3-i20]GKU77354.1 hypothetical protein L3i20_v217510 [Paenibacillus sp. L3-i20]